ncbi:MAG: hypothetical protein AAFR20_06965 [Pseudomonadota bacterium]
MKMNKQQANRFDIKTVSTAAVLASLNLSAFIIPAAAQDVVTIEEALQICNRVTNARDRLDCFEGLADAASPDQERSVSKTTDTPEPSAAQSLTQENSSSADRTALEPGKNPPVEDLDSNTSETNTPAKPRKRFVIIPEEEAKERFARELTPREKGKPYQASVRKAWTNGFGKLMVLLDNGEVWKQTEGGRPRIPKVGVSANLTKSPFGSWFVRFPNNYRSLRMKIINPE